VKAAVPGMPVIFRISVDDYFPEGLQYAEGKQVALWAAEAGADAVKIFPCGNVGGAKYIKALKGPFPHIEMVPTGGVNLETVGDFLKAK